MVNDEESRGKRLPFIGNTVFFVHELTDLAHFRDPAAFYIFGGICEEEETRFGNEHTRYMGD